MLKAFYDYKKSHKISKAIAMSTLSMGDYDVEIIYMALKFGAIILSETQNKKVSEENKHIHSRYIFSNLVRQIILGGVGSEIKSSASTFYQIYKEESIETKELLEVE